MTQLPPPPPASLPPNPLEYGYGYTRRRTNGAAIASLILGIVGCIPFIPGLLAIIFGGVGIRKTRDPAVGGKGLAIAGLVLGIISVVCWGLFTAAPGYSYMVSRPAAVIAKQFLHDVSAGNVNAALANSSGIPAAQLQTNTQQIQQFGTLQSITFTSFFVSSQTSGQTVNLGGGAIFSTGPKTCTFVLIQQGTTYKVTAFNVR